MDGQLKNGSVLTSVTGIPYTVLSLLGEGGQGAVYRVESGGGEYALKWYNQRNATDQQESILAELIRKGSPDKSFLWPQDLIAPEAGKLGYIMPLRPAKFVSPAALLKGRVSPSFYVLCRTAYNLADGYRKLHARGDCYRDISLGNLFFDPDTGDVLICDNDNVAPRGVPCGVSGTPGFMAPEIVRGEDMPSANTDRFSLANLFFHLFMLGHPLDGRNEYNIRCKDMAAMKYLYGQNPIFAFDPDNDSNRPVPDYHTAVLAFWEIYPRQLKDLFVKSFTSGLTNPNVRITESEWMNAFAALMVTIRKCACGAEVFYDPAKYSHSCWCCGQPVRMPAVLKIGRCSILLTPSTAIRSHHLFGDYDMDTVAGTLAQHPKDPKIWGIRNETTENWTCKTPDGQTTIVPPGRSVRILRGVKISFGYKNGVIV